MIHGKIKLLAAGQRGLFCFVVVATLLVNSACIIMMAQLLLGFIDTDEYGLHMNRPYTKAEHWFIKLIAVDSDWQWLEHISRQSFFITFHLNLLAGNVRNRT